MCKCVVFPRNTHESSSSSHCFQGYEFSRVMCILLSNRETCCMEHSDESLVFGQCLVDFFQVSNHPYVHLSKVVNFLSVLRSFFGQVYNSLYHILLKLSGFGCIFGVS